MVLQRLLQDPPMPNPYRATLQSLHRLVPRTLRCHCISYILQEMNLILLSLITKGQWPKLTCFPVCNACFFQSPSSAYEIPPLLHLPVTGPKRVLSRHKRLNAWRLACRDASDCAPCTHQTYLACIALRLHRLDQCSWASPQC